VIDNPTPTITAIGNNMSTTGIYTTYQWYHDGNVIPGATEYFYVAPASGNYNVVATDANGCEVEAAIFDVVAGIQLADAHSQLTIFPNPVSESITITGAVLVHAEIEISIYNMIGKKIMDVQAIPLSDNKWKADVSKLSSGIYWLTVTDQENISRIPFTKK
jgi:hypothetical protein